MLESPFNPGAGTRPPVLAGRDALLADAEALLTGAVHFGRAVSPLVWTGVRGVGKTAALLDVRRRAEESGFAVAHVTADPGGGLPGRVAEAIAGALAAAGITRRGSGWDRLTERLSAFNIQVSVAGVVRVSTDLAAAATLPRTTQDMFRSLVSEAALEIAEAGRAGLMITLDELQEAPIDDLRVLVYAIQELTVAGAPMVILAAGLPALPERLMEAGSFAERFSFRRLANLTPEATLRALIEPAAEEGVRWAEPAANAIAGISGGSPYLIQLYADAAWRVASPEAGTIIGNADVAAGVSIAEQRLWDGQYRGRWNRATPAERKLLTAIAHSLDEQGVASSSDVSARLGKSTTSLSRARAGLLDRASSRRPGTGNWLSPSRASNDLSARSPTPPDRVPSPDAIVRRPWTHDHKAKAPDRRCRSGAIFTTCARGDLNPDPRGPLTCGFDVCAGQGQCTAPGSSGSVQKCKA